jgi:hypothetical protein
MPVAPRKTTEALAVLVAAMSAAAWSCGVAAAAPGGAGTVVPLKQLYRTCNFASSLSPAVTGHGIAEAEIKSASSTVTAQVHLTAAEPNTPYNVRLIQAPSSSPSCGPGDPGVTAGVLGTDALGAGSITLTTRVAGSATGVWVALDRPAAHAQTPSEYYTSDIIVPI